MFSLKSKFSKFPISLPVVFVVDVGVVVVVDVVVVAGVVVGRVKPKFALVKPEDSISIKNI